MPDVQKGLEVAMSEKISLEMISRRGAFSLLGVAAALSLAVPATVMTATDAEARVGNPGSAVSVAGANRRDRRQDRRYNRRVAPFAQRFRALARGGGSRQCRGRDFVVARVCAPGLSPQSRQRYRSD